MWDGIMKHKGEWDGSLHILFCLQEWCERRMQPRELGNRAFGTSGAGTGARNPKHQSMSHRSDVLIFHRPEHPCERGRNQQFRQFLWKFRRTLRPIQLRVKILIRTATIVGSNKMRYCRQRRAPSIPTYRDWRGATSG